MATALLHVFKQNLLTTPLLQYLLIERWISINKGADLSTEPSSSVCACCLSG